MPESSQLAGFFLTPLSNGMTPLRVISLPVMCHPGKKLPPLQLPILCLTSEFKAASALQCHPGSVVAAALCDPTPTPHPALGLGAVSAPPPDDFFSRRITKPTRNK